MDITTLNGKRIYLDNLAGLTYKGKVDQPVDITVQETDGEVIIKMRRYPDFSGEINLDLSRVLAPYAKIKNPLTEGRNEAIEFPLTITVSTSVYPQTSASYKFTLVFLHSSAMHYYSDIDFLRVPDAVSIPVSAYVPKDTRITFVTETSEGSEFLMESTLMTANCVYPFNIDVRRVKKNADGRFRIAMVGSSVTRSPVYQVCSGEWQHYLFRNRLGFLEYFPMSGDIRIAPSYKFETAEYGQDIRRVSTDCDVVIQQYTGSLTRRASRALGAMLIDGYAYHYIRGAWNRIIIEEAEVGISSFDTSHRQRFSFRYQEPLSITSINI